MPERPSDIAFTAAVKAEQAARGSRAMYERTTRDRPWADRVTPDLAAFLAARDSFYFATAKPYIQHRGGPQGFLTPLDDKTLAFADFAGNRQYISLGNLAENPRAHIFVIDYANRQRVKIWGRARVVEGDEALLARLADAAYRGRPERVIVFEIGAWDINCPSHITPRYDQTVIAEAVETLTSRLAELEAEIARLKGESEKS